MTKTNIYPLVVAAGTGSRFGGELPKQYVRIANKSVLAHSISRLNHPALSALTLVLSAEDAWVDQVLPEIQASFALPIHLAIGGAERWQSVMSGLTKICQNGAKDNDWVLIHDAARPCLPKADLQKMIDKIHTDDASAIILASAVVDTLKYATDGRISHTVDRRNLWQSLTPQAFKINLLKDAFEFVMTHDIDITDEAAACEAMGVAVHMIAASRMNIKLTHPEDLSLIAGLVEQNGS